VAAGTVCHASVAAQAGRAASAVGAETHRIGRGEMAERQIDGVAPPWPGARQQRVTRLARHRDGFMMRIR
jgi:hypothetical protein